MTRSTLLALAAGAVLLTTGCAETRTLGELGHPEFADVVGAETRFQRADPKQEGALDVFPSTVEDEASHEFTLESVPVGVADRVGFELKAKPKGHLPIERVAVRAFAVSRTEGEAFKLTGKLPNPGAPLPARVEAARQEDGTQEVALVIERVDIPKGTERLAIPILVRFKDGWIHVSFYETGVPAVARALTPEEIEELKRQQAGEPPPAGPAKPPAGPEQERPAGPPKDDAR